MSSQSLEELLQRIVEVVTAEFSDIAFDVHLRYTPSGAIEQLRNFEFAGTFHVPFVFRASFSFGLL